MYKCNIVVPLNDNECRSWIERRVVWTKDHIYIARAGENTFIDFLPLSETELISISEEVEKHTNKDMSVKETHHEHEKGAKHRNSRVHPEHVSEHDRWMNGSSSSFLVLDRSGRPEIRVEKGVEKPHEIKAVLQIHTIHDGFNSGFCLPLCITLRKCIELCSFYFSGRAYYFRIPSRQLCLELVENFKKRAERAKREADAKSKFVKNQELALHMFNSNIFQFFVACLIFAVSTCNPIAALLLSNFDHFNPKAEFHHQCGADTAQWTHHR